ncbi:MAG: YfhO family protein, partial [Flectobacillus sp.]|nr:YfhO family protein [Flectobacillus sp.]
ATEVGNLAIKADSTNKIALTTYKPNEVTYQSDAKTEQLAIFSEIFYRGNEDWKAYVDGQYKPHFRADYILRGMVVPAGKHTIVFKFEPESVRVGNKVDLVASIMLVCLLGLALFFEVKKKK